MEIQTKAYGPLEIEDRQQIFFPNGILGFEEHRRYALFDAHKKPFFWLQSLDETRVAFILLKVSVFRDDYEPGITLNDLKEIGAESLDDCLVFAIVTVPDSGPMTANLQGPVFINRKTLQGKQCISPRDEYRTRHDILLEMAQRRTE